jgi:hypothetical protein
MRAFDKNCQAHMYLLRKKAFCQDNGIDLNNKALMSLSVKTESWSSCSIKAKKRFIAFVQYAVTKSFTFIDYGLRMTLVIHSF